jgi:hypothetical protein
MADTQAAIAALRELASRADEAATHALATGAPDPETVRTLGEELAVVITEHPRDLVGPTRNRLEQLAAQATGTDQRRRPPARTFAARLRAATPARRPVRSARRPALAVSLLMAVGVAVVTAPEAGTTAGPDGEALPLATDPATIEIDGVAYTVGRPGDVALAAPSSCDDAEVVLLRPATGALYAFDHLATPGGPVTGELVGHAAGAVDLAPAACALSPIDSTGQPVPTVTIAQEPPS